MRGISTGLIIGTALWWLSLVVAVVIIERTLQDVPTDVLVIVALVLAALALPLLYHSWVKGRAPQHDKRVQDFSDFDMPIDAAVDHIVDTTHYTFTRSSLAERNAFAQLYTAMCSGRLPAIGREGEATMPRKISRRQRKRLDCIEMATPQGIRFQLIDREQNKRIADGIL